MLPRFTCRKYFPFSSHSEPCPSLLTLVIYSPQDGPPCLHSQLHCAFVASQVEKSLHLAEVLSTLFLYFLKLYFTCSFLFNMYQASICNILEAGRYKDDYEVVFEKIMTQDMPMLNCYVMSIMLTCTLGTQKM